MGPPADVIDTLDGHGPAVFQAAEPDLARFPVGRVKGSFPGQDADDLEPLSVEDQGPGCLLALITGVTFDLDLVEIRSHGMILPP